MSNRKQTREERRYIAEKKHKIIGPEIYALFSRISSELNTLNLSYNHKNIILSYLTTNCDTETVRWLYKDIFRLGFEPDEDKLKRNLNIVSELQNITQGITYSFYDKSNGDLRYFKDVLDHILTDTIVLRTANDKNPDVAIFELNLIKETILDNLKIFIAISKSVNKKERKNKARYDAMLKYGVVEASIVDMLSSTSISYYPLYRFISKFQNIGDMDIKLKWHKELSKVPSDAFHALIFNHTSLLKSPHNYRFIKGYLVLYDQWLEGVKNNPDNVEQRLNTASIILRRKLYNTDKDKYNEVMTPLTKTLCEEKVVEEKAKQFQKSDIINQS